MTIYKYGHTHANITTLFFTNAENTNGGETQIKSCATQTCATLGNTSFKLSAKVV